jgi:ribosomal protein S18 acetylase RimI-like enzyme
VAFYKLDDGVCEVKRLWVRPNFRGKKVGRILVERLIDEARQIGYQAIVLSTVDVLKEAIGLYQSFGFEVIKPYYEMPEEMLAHEILMRLDLSS